MIEHINLLGVDIYTNIIHGDIQCYISQADSVHLQAIEQVKSPSRRREILATRQLIDNILGHGTRLEHNADGSPVLADRRLNISVSHCCGHVAIALHRDLAIGIDIETWRDTLLAVKRKYLSPDEEALFGTPAELLQAWTAKEAVYKAARISGLPLHDIRLYPEGRPDCAIVRHGDINHRYQLASVQVGEDALLTLALKITGREEL